MNGSEQAGGLPILEYILISLSVGIVVALVAVLIMRAQLKSVRRKHGAREYVVPDTFEIVYREDHFLYDEVRRHPRPKADKDD